MLAQVGTGRGGPAGRPIPSITRVVKIRQLVGEKHLAHHPLAVQVHMGLTQVRVLPEAEVQMSPSKRATCSTRKGIPKLFFSSARV